MWIVFEYRRSVSTPRRPYRTDLSDARWVLIEPLLSQWRSERRRAAGRREEPSAAILDEMPLSTGHRRERATCRVRARPAVPGSSALSCGCRLADVGLHVAPSSATVAAFSDAVRRFRRYRIPADCARNVAIVVTATPSVAPSRSQSNGAS
jgi:hypothetical protein